MISQLWSFRYNNGSTENRDVLTLRHAGCSQQLVVIWVSASIGLDPKISNDQSYLSWK